MLDAGWLRKKAAEIIFERVTSVGRVDMGMRTKYTEIWASVV